MKHTHKLCAALCAVLSMVFVSADLMAQGQDWRNPVGKCVDPRGCGPSSGGGGRAGTGGMTSLQQQQLELAGQAGHLLGTLLREALFGNPEQEAQRRAAEEQARQEAWRAQVERMKAEEERKQAMRDRLLATLKGVDPAPQLTFKGVESNSSPNFKLDAPSRWSASPPDSPATSSGLQFRFGDSAPSQTITLAEIPASSAMAQLTRAAYFSEQALAARSPEESKAFADAAFDGAIGVPVDLPVPNSIRTVQVRDADTASIENVRKQYQQASDQAQQSVGRVNDAEQQRELAERILREARARLASAERVAAAASSGERSLRQAELEKERRIAEEAQALIDAQDRKRSAAYDQAMAAQAIVATSAKGVLDMLESMRTRNGGESALIKGAYIRGIQDASKCIPANNADYCSTLRSAEAQACISNYTNGYREGEQNKDSSLREASEIGRQAKQTNNLLIGINHPKSVGSCQAQWVQAYYRGYGRDDSLITASHSLKVDLDKPVALLRSGPGPDAIRWTPVPLAWREQRDTDFASAAAEGRIRLGSLENVRQLALYDYLLLPGSGSLQAALESNRWLGNFGPDEGIAAYLNGYTPGPANPFGQIAAIHDAKGAKWDDYAARVAGEQSPFDPRGWREAIVDAASIQARYLGSRVVYEVEYAFLIDSRNR